MEVVSCAGGGVGVVILQCRSSTAGADSTVRSAAASTVVTVTAAAAAAVAGTVVAVAVAIAAVTTTIVPINLPIDDEPAHPLVSANALALASCVLKIIARSLVQFLELGGVGEDTRYWLGR